MTIPSLRTDNTFYDGPGELSRDSVIATYEAHLSGRWLTPQDVFKEEGNAHNTYAKARGILEYHGYHFQHQPLTSGKSKKIYFSYRALNWTRVKPPNISCPGTVLIKGKEEVCGISDFYQIDGKCSRCGHRYAAPKRIPKREFHHMEPKPIPESYV